MADGTIRRSNNPAARVKRVPDDVRVEISTDGFGTDKLAIHVLWNIPVFINITIPKLDFHQTADGIVSDTPNQGGIYGVAAHRTFSTSRNITKSILESSEGHITLSDMSQVLNVFARCVEAARQGVNITRANRQDKEFHFQNWFKARLDDLKVLYEQGGRNSYPDFRLVQETEGYEIKGLAYPGRSADYDCNSQVPSGFHNGRTIFYVFGRYPADVEENEYPLIDLVICHGDFLNADHNYVHKNKSVKGFGSYGDIMIRDRKMYVAPTPFGLTTGTDGKHTLILPIQEKVDERFDAIGTLVRTETEKLVVGYSFDLSTNTIEKRLIDNPKAGTTHEFGAYRLKQTSVGNVAMRSKEAIKNVIESATANDE